MHNRVRLPYNPAVIILTCLIFCCCNSAPNRNSNSDSPVVPTSKIDLSNPLSQLDQSPMDMAYFPVEYSKLKMLGKADQMPYARVIFSRPQKNGRKIFDNVVKFGEPWRLGANEATEIEFFRDATIQNKKVPKGTYVVYTIPSKDQWRIILNGDLYTWGLKIDSTKDLFQFDIPIIKLQVPIEVFTMEFEKSDSGANLLMGWDDTKASLPIQFQ